MKTGTRVALTKKAAAEGLGMELVMLSAQWLSDGKFEPTEMEQLRAWLAKVPSDALPAIAFLKEEVEQYVADGAVYPWELSRLQAALIRIIPKEYREQAKAAKAKADAAQRELETVERTTYYAESSSDWAEIRRRNADIWCRQPATDAQRDYIYALGGVVTPSMSKLEASETIDMLLGNLPIESSSSSSGARVFFIVLALAVVGAFILKKLGAY